MHAMVCLEIHNPNNKLRYIATRHMTYIYSHVYYRTLYVRPALITLRMIAQVTFRVADEIDARSIVSTFISSMVALQYLSVHHMLADILRG